ncbi:hypothetical protein FKG94_22100 [Exilibacterium tricleocarpae]|uniref:Uncharacterized protein n=1 Tax=Exilibacterium tricleocarpae TaxID=2591008 RepID=A0A545SZ56_9GAMM|nr:hypothetical protein [Exilibacterium tricleocarpae]TQV70209.1 hypothetical protein FKG94_22100 [Exilibacterium tricleocarpae]
MTEPYLPPKSDLEDPRELNLGLGVYIVAVIIVLLSASLYYWMYSVTTKFMDVFTSFNTELPAVIAVLVEYRALFLILGLLSFMPLSLLFLRRLSYKVKSRLFKSIVLSGVLAFIGTLAFHWVLYELMIDTA